MVSFCASFQATGPLETISKPWASSRFTKMCNDSNVCYGNKSKTKINRKRNKFFAVSSYPRKMLDVTCDLCKILTFHYPRFIIWRLDTFWAFTDLLKTFFPSSRILQTIIFAYHLAEIFIPTTHHHFSK